MKAADIKKVFVIGAGTMAAHISAQFLLFGREVVVFARSEEKKNRLIDRVKNEVMGPRIAEGYFTEAYRNEVMKNLSFIISDHSQMPQDIDLVTESVYEDYAAKEDAWKAFAPYLPKHAILTTDSSSLYPSKYAEACGAPERFMAMHFSMPTFYRNVMDIEPLPKTKPEVVEVVKELAKELNMNPCVMQKETPGFLHNNMLYSFLNMGLTLYRTGAASIEDIDRAWMGVRQEQSGPFGILDAAGIDTMYDILKQWSGIDKENLPIMEEKLAKGETGEKAGKGFYDYPNPAYRQPEFLQRASKIGK